MSLEEEIKVSLERYGIAEADLVKDLFGRRYGDYFSWMTPEVDSTGGLLTLGRVAIVGGQHGSGKTTWVTELAKFNAQSKSTMLIPLEMGTDFTVMMLACNMFNNRRKNGIAVLGYGEVEEGYLYNRPQKDQELFKECIRDLYKDYPYLFINNPPYNDFEALLKMIEVYYLEFGIKFFIIDHLHQLDSSKERDGETAFYSKVAKELKLLAERLGIALLCVVQLTKLANSGKGDLDLSAFKGTSEFSSNAHRVVMIKKPTFVPLKDNECAKWLATHQEGLGILDTEDKEQVRAIYEERFRKETRHIREIVFLKTRGRDGGTVTIEMQRGRFKFSQHGPYMYQRF